MHAFVLILGHEVDEIMSRPLPEGTWVGQFDSWRRGGRYSGAIHASTGTRYEENEPDPLIAMLAEDTGLPITEPGRTDYGGYDQALARDIERFAALPLIMRSGTGDIIAPEALAFEPVAYDDEGRLTIEYDWHQEMRSFFNREVDAATLITVVDGHA